MLYTEKKTVVYSPEYDLKMDIYYPESTRRDDRALVVTLHSGGFAGGARDDELQVRTIEAFLKEGFIVASPDYRLGMRSFKSTLNNAAKAFKYFPSILRDCIRLAVSDCARAIAYLYRNAGCQGLNLDKNQIILAGSSAGAIIALEIDYLRVTQGIDCLPYYWRPKAVIAYSGAILHFYGYPAFWEEEDRPFYSLSRSAKQCMPAPTLMVHGTKDKIIRFGSSLFGSCYDGLDGSKTIAKHIVKVGGCCYEIWVEGAGHEVSEIMPDTMGYIMDFLNGPLLDQSKLLYLQPEKLDLGEKSQKWKDKNVFQLIREYL